jgi:hypothetical protein
MKKLMVIFFVLFLIAGSSYSHLQDQSYDHGIQDYEVCKKNDFFSRY